MNEYILSDIKNNLRPKTYNFQRNSLQILEKDTLFSVFSQNQDINKSILENNKLDFFFKTAFRAKVKDENDIKILYSLSEYLSLDFTAFDIFSIVQAMETYQHDYRIINPEENNSCKHVNSLLPFQSNDRFQKYTPLSLSAPKSTYDFLYNVLFKEGYNLEANNYFVLLFLKNFFEEKELDKAIENFEHQLDSAMTGYTGLKSEKRITRSMEYKKLDYCSEQYRFNDLNETNWLNTLQQSLENSIENKHYSTTHSHKISNVTLFFKSFEDIGNHFIYKDVILFDTDNFRMISFSPELKLKTDIFAYMKEAFNSTTYLVNDIIFNSDKEAVFKIEINTLIKKINQYTKKVNDNDNLNTVSLRFYRTLNVSENKMMFGLYGKKLPFHNDQADRDEHFKKHIKEIESLGQIQLLDSSIEPCGILYSLEVKINKRFN